MGLGEKTSFTVMPTVDFNKIILPNFMADLTGTSESNLPLCPREYNEQLKIR